MSVSRNDVIGVICAVCSVALIAWLSLDSWEIAECRDLIARVEGGAVPSTDDDLPACQAMLGLKDIPAE